MQIVSCFNSSTSLLGLDDTCLDSRCTRGLHESQFRHEQPGLNRACRQAVCAVLAPVHILLPYTHTSAPARTTSSQRILSAGRGCLVRSVGAHAIWYRGAVKLRRAMSCECQVRHVPEYDYFCGTQDARCVGIWASVQRTLPSHAEDRERQGPCVTGNFPKRCDMTDWTSSATNLVTHVRFHAWSAHACPCPSSPCPDECNIAHLSGSLVTPRRCFSASLAKSPYLPAAHV